MRRSGEEEFKFLLIIGTLTAVFGGILLAADVDAGIVLIIIGVFGTAIAAARRLSRGFRR